MPELVNISVGSLPGTSEDDGTTVWPLLAKKSRKVLRMSATDMAEGGVLETVDWVMVCCCCCWQARGAGMLADGKRRAEKRSSPKPWIISLPDAAL